MRVRFCFLKLQIGEPQSTNSKRLRKELRGSSLHLLHTICIINLSDVRIPVQRKEWTSIINQFDEERFESTKFQL